MRLYVALLVAIGFAISCKKPLKSKPGIFYAAAIMIDVVYMAATYGFVGGWVKDISFLVVQKSTLAVALFIVVMFIGTFPAGSRPRSYLMPIRAGLSIIATFLALGHICAYAGSYLYRIPSGFESAPASLKLSLVTALVLFVLIVVLGVTSFNFVKRKMSGTRWKSIQRWAYLFYGFVYLHLALMLAPSALAGSRTAIGGMIAYTIIFGSYAVARILRYRIDHRAGLPVDLGDNRFKG